MSNEMVMSASISKIVPALQKAKKSMGAATKGSNNPYFKSSYADLNAVREASEPSLVENEIMTLQPTIQKEGKSYVRTLLLHSSGEFIGSDTEIVCAKVNDPQAYGSGITYARRYGLQALLNLGTEDDDAEGAMGRGKTKTTKATSSSAGGTGTGNPTVENNVTPITEKKVTFRPPKAAQQASTESEAEWQ